MQTRRQKQSRQCGPVCGPVWHLIAIYACYVSAILIMRKMMELDREVSGSLNISDPTKTKKIVILISHHSCGQIRRREENSGFCVGKQILMQCNNCCEWFGSFWAWPCPTLLRVKHTCRVVVIILYILNLALSTWYLLLVSNFFWFDSPTHIDYFYDIWLANELSMYAFSFFTFQWNWTSTSLPSQFFVIRLTCMNHPPSRQLTSTCNLIVLPLRNVFLFYMLLMLTSACFVIG